MDERRPLTVVTGAAGALGGSVARRLAADGHALALLDLPGTRARLEVLAASLGPLALALPGEYREEPAWADALGRTEVSLNAPVTGAFLAAGGWEGGAPVHGGRGLATWRRMMSVNAESALLALSALLPGMVARGAGSVVAVGSIAAVRPERCAGAAAYAASKAALVALVQAVAAEVGPHGVRVNAVLPGTLDTPANRVAMPGADPAAWLPLDSVAGVVAFLLSGEARDVSGAALPLGGPA